MIVCAALVVPPDSNVYVPQELAHRKVGLDYGNGTAYAGLQMLEGAVPREAISTCAAVIHPGERYAAMLRGEFEATVLQEPWITVAEKAGCRLVSTTFFHGTWVGGADLDPRLYAAFLRGVTQAVHRINTDKRRYVRYFKEGWAAADADVGPDAGRGTRLSDCGRVDRCLPGARDPLHRPRDQFSRRWPARPARSAAAAADVGRRTTRSPRTPARAPRAGPCY